MFYSLYCAGGSTLPLEASVDVMDIDCGCSDKNIAWKHYILMESSSCGAGRGRDGWLAWAGREGDACDGDQAGGQGRGDCGHCGVFKGERGNCNHATEEVETRGEVGEHES